MSSKSSTRRRRQERRRRQKARRTARPCPPMPQSKRTVWANPQCGYVLHVLPLAVTCSRAGIIGAEALRAGVPPEVVSTAIVARSLLAAA